MIVYGDIERSESPCDAIASLARAAAEVTILSPGAPRYARAAHLLISAGEIAQGIIDFSFYDRGVDADGAMEEAVERLVYEAALLLARIERGERELGAPAVSAFLALAGELLRSALPDVVTVKVPEGYAFYALYPEMYRRAAEALAEDAAGERLVVLGIRSIGTSLGAAVAAGANTRRPPITLRPVGHPFQRTVSIASSLERAILARPHDTSSGIFAIVDEGPGLSGSSFGAVGDWLEDRGVPPSRMVFFPSHAGEPGAFASERHRARYRSARRCFVGFDTMFLSGPRPRLASMIEGCVGAPVASIEDISGGRWRAKVYRDEGEWPPACPYRERRKFLAGAPGGVKERLLFVKFAGLGRHGDAMLARSARLSEAGFCPRAHGLAHGFLIGDWLAEARPLRLGENFERRRALERVGVYIGFLAKELPASGSGATPSRLLEMARFNTKEALGEELAAELDRFVGSVPALESAARRVCTDNKMQMWEWLVLPDGRLLKADALDHHAAHDLIGPQDPAWDIAGASVELGLSEEEQALLVEVVARSSSYRADPEALTFYSVCYLAFQVGLYSMAVSIDGASNVGERARLEQACGGYALRLRRGLERLCTV